MACDELLVLRGIGAVFPYVAEATLNWVRRHSAH